jgi:hypothetical protein
VLVKGQTINDVMDVRVFVNPLLVGDVDEGFDKLNAPLVNLFPRGILVELWLDGFDQNRWNLAFNETVPSMEILSLSQEDILSSCCDAALHR